LLSKRKEKNPKKLQSKDI